VLDSVRQALDYGPEGVRIKRYFVNLYDRQWLWLQSNISWSGRDSNRIVRGGQVQALPDSQGTRMGKNFPAEKAPEYQGPTHNRGLPNVLDQSSHFGSPTSQGVAPKAITPE